MIGQLATSLAALFAQLVVVQYVRISARALTNWGLGAAFVSCALFLIFGNFALLVVGPGAVGSRLRHGAAGIHLRRVAVGGAA